MTSILHENLSLLVELWLNRVDALLMVGVHDCHRHPHPDPPGGGEVIHPS